VEGLYKVKKGNYVQVTDKGSPCPQDGRIEMRERLNRKGRNVHVDSDEDVE
jgi:hypothetical protein